MFIFAEARNTYQEFCVPICILPATISNNISGTELSMGSDTVLSMIVEVRAAGPCQPARTQNEDYVPLPCGWSDLTFCTAQQAICPRYRLYSLCELWWSVFAGLGESGGSGEEHCWSVPCRQEARDTPLPAGVGGNVPEGSRAIYTWDTCSSLQPRSLRS